MISRILPVIEIAVLSALILVTRCANYQDIFVAGNIYFADSDCYARMTRVRLCATTPGLILRHHDFENYPQGTTPHTTAPLDYLIVGLALPFKPFTTQSLDVAGAFVSPLLALAGAWFLWWWSRRMKFRYRWATLILFAISPILVHGTALGRPDHQSLLLLLVTIGICAEWRLQTAADSRFGVAGTADATERNRLAAVSGAAWGFAIWVSAYEPLVLFLIVLITNLLLNPRTLFGRERRARWIWFTAIIAAALIIERRVPSFAMPESSAILKNWASTIGELAHVLPANPVWFHWCGYLVLVAPFLIWISIRTRKDGAQGLQALPIYVLLIATFFLTIWQARWAYFFVLIFALALPALLAPIKSCTAVWVAFVLSIFPVLRDWDETLWPDETELASHAEKRIESSQIREVALMLASSQLQPFLAPWWLSPSIAYWSGQPGVAGSSHESLKGIEDSARFFLSSDLKQARSILHKDNVAWVFAYDSQRVTQNSAAVLDEVAPADPLCGVLDRTSGQAPPFLIFSAQTPACKLYRVSIER